MIHYQNLCTFLQEHPRLNVWLETLACDIAYGLDVKRHGDLPDWYHALSQLPTVATSKVSLNDDIIIGSSSDTDTKTIAKIQHALEALIPWRKGPFTIHGIHIDTEWRSDWKWERISKHIAPLKNRLVLDVGCGNGYHCWRMLGAGASRVIGIDPSPRFVIQFRAIKHFAGNHYPIDILPLGIEHLPKNLKAFDTTFSMGVFYHRRSPMDHLRELKETLRDGGQLVLETLVIEGKLGDVFVPPKRYAMMNNVWFLPSTDTLLAWLEKCGFKNAKVINVCPTTINEQRATPWMRYHSLADFLDKKKPSLTVEGHPAPIRAVIVADA